MPQFYLRGFANSKHDKLIWVYEKDVTDPYCSSPSNIAVQKHFYSLEMHDGSRDYVTIENGLKSIEDRVAPIVLKVEANQIVTESERHWLTYFVALMSLRVPSSRHFIETMLVRETMKIARRNVSEESGFAKILDGSVRIAMNDNWYLQYIFEGALNIGKRLSALRQVYLRANREYKFATSPNPFGRVFLLGDQVQFAAKPSMDRKGLWFFPLSQNICLCFTESCKSDGYEDADNAGIRHFNRLTIGRSRRFVFYPRKSECFNRFVQKSIGTIQEY